MLVRIQSMTSSLHPNQGDIIVSYILREGTDGIGASADTGDNGIRQAAFLVKDLLARLLADKDRKSVV